MPLRFHWLHGCSNIEMENAKLHIRLYFWNSSSPSLMCTKSLLQWKKWKQNGAYFTYFAFFSLIFLHSTRSFFFMLLLFIFRDAVLVLCTDIFISLWVNWKNYMLQLFYYIYLSTFLAFCSTPSSQTIHFDIAAMEHKHFSMNIQQLHRLI